MEFWNAQYLFVTSYDKIIMHQKHIHFVRGQRSKNFIFQSFKCYKLGSLATAETYDRIWIFSVALAFVATARTHVIHSSIPAFSVHHSTIAECLCQIACHCRWGVDIPKRSMHASPCSKFRRQYCVVSAALEAASDEQRWAQDALNIFIYAYTTYAYARGRWIFYDLTSIVAHVNTCSTRATRFIKTAQNMHMRVCHRE